MNIFKWLTSFWVFVLAGVPGVLALADVNEHPSPGFVIARHSSQPLLEEEAKKQGYFMVDIKLGLSRDSPPNRRIRQQVTSWQRDIQINVVPLSTSNDFNIIVTAPNKGDGVLIQEGGDNLAPGTGYQSSIQFVKNGSDDNLQKKIFFKGREPITYSRLDFTVRSGKYSREPLYLIVGVYTNVEGFNNTEYDYVYTTKRKIDKLEREFGMKSPADIFPDPDDLRTYEAYSRPAGSSQSQVDPVAPEAKMKSRYEAQIKDYVARQAHREESQQDARNGSSFTAKLSPRWQPVLFDLLWQKTTTPKDLPAQAEMFRGWHPDLRVSLATDQSDCQLVMESLGADTGIMEDKRKLHNAPASGYLPRLVLPFAACDVGEGFNTHVYIKGRGGKFYTRMNVRAQVKYAEDRGMHYVELQGQTLTDPAGKGNFEISSELVQQYVEAVKAGKPNPYSYDPGGIIPTEEEAEKLSIPLLQKPRLPKRIGTASEGSSTEGGFFDRLLTFDPPPGFVEHKESGNAGIARGGIVYDDESNDPYTNGSITLSAGLGRPISDINKLLQLKQKEFSTNKNAELIDARVGEFAGKDAVIIIYKAINREKDLFIKTYDFPIAYTSKGTTYFSATLIAYAKERLHFLDEYVNDEIKFTNDPMIKF